jgi:hypothetical protein
MLSRRTKSRTQIGPESTPIGMRSVIGAVAISTKRELGLMYRGVRGRGKLPVGRAGPLTTADDGDVLSVDAPPR